MTSFVDSRGNVLLVTDARDKRERTVALGIPVEDQEAILDAFCSMKMVEGSR